MNTRLQRLSGTGNQFSNRQRRYPNRRGGRVGTASVPHVQRLEDRTLLAAVTVPTGIDAGDSYRLAFVTSTTRDGTSSDIADYNESGQNPLRAGCSGRSGILEGDRYHIDGRRTRQHRDEL